MLFTSLQSLSWPYLLRSCHQWWLNPSSLFSTEKIPLCYIVPLVMTTTYYQILAFSSCAYCHYLTIIVWVTKDFSWAGYNKEFTCTVERAWIEDSYYWFPNFNLGSELVELKYGRILAVEIPKLWLFKVPGKQLHTHSHCTVCHTALHCPSRAW